MGAPVYRSEERCRRNFDAAKAKALRLIESGDVLRFMEQYAWMNAAAYALPMSSELHYKLTAERADFLEEMQWKHRALFSSDPNWVPWEEQARREQYRCSRVGGWPNPIVDLEDVAV